MQSQTPPIVYVTRDGSGDYHCDGTSDQVEINQALDYVAANPDFTTVYLKGANTYWIDEPIYISSNTILEGDSTAVIKLVDKANWQTKFKGLIMQKGATFTIAINDTTNALHDITIRGFEIDGNRQNQEEPSGHSYYNMIKLQNCYNLTISDMLMHDNLADIVNITSGVYGFRLNLKFYNNRVYASGHDGIYILNCEHFEIYDNIFSNNRTDAHIRAQQCNHFKIHNNVCGNNPDARNSGGIGIDIQVKANTPINDVEIYGNYLYGKGAFSGIWLWQTNKGGDLNTHRDVYIHHNIIENYQGAGIAIYGFNNTIIENNVIEHNGKGTNHAYTDNVSPARQSGIAFYEGGNKHKVKGYTTVVRNNIIGNNAAYGIENRKPSLHKFISEYNCIYNNNRGSYKKASSRTDIYVYPDFACENHRKEEDGRISYTYYILSPKWQEAKETGNIRGDFGAKEAINIFHLKSKEGRWDADHWVYDDVTSFCINMGSPHSDYHNEPFPNGGIVNIGAFGNTEFASMSDEIPDVHTFMAYPNPTRGLVTVSEEFCDNEYFIYSTSGALVKTAKIADCQIDLSDLPNGVYLIRIKQYKLEKWKTGRVVKIN